MGKVLKNELRGKEDWNVVWKGVKFPKYLKTKTCFAREFHSLIIKHFSQKSKVLEIGCASAQFLVYFKEYFGCDIYGVDYSETGCELAKKNLEITSHRGVIFCDDIFNSTKLEKKSFDIVFSGGFVEHFENTTGVISKHLEFIKPGGLLIIELPNMLGLHGMLFKWLNNSVYKKHKLLKLKELEDVYKQLDIEILENKYFGSVIFESGGRPLYLVPIFHIINKVIYYLTKLFNCSFNSQNISPYIILIGKKNG